MGVKLIKSEDYFSFHLDGKNSIDAKILSELIGDIAELTKFAALEENPDAYLKMNVTAFENGSFQINFSAICEFAENLINNVLPLAEFASITISTVKEFFEIKKFLKGKKAKSIKVQEDGKVIVTSEDNNSMVANNSSIAILNNPHIDNLVVKITSNVSDNNSDGGFSFDTSSESIHFDKNDVSNMRKPLPIVEESIIKTTVILVDLPIKKADLLGYSTWSFIYNGKQIEAKIDDVDFLEKIHNGQFSIHGGDYITAELEISVNMDNGVLDNSTAKYAIRKVKDGVKNDFKNSMKSFI